MEPRREHTGAAHAREQLLKPPATALQSLRVGAEAVAIPPASLDASLADALRQGAERWGARVKGLDHAAMGRHFTDADPQLQRMQAPHARADGGASRGGGGARLPVLPLQAHGHHAQAAVDGAGRAYEGSALYTGSMRHASHGDSSSSAPSSGAAGASRLARRLADNSYNDYNYCYSYAGAVCPPCQQLPFGLPCVVSSSSRSSRRLAFGPCA